MGVGLRGMLGQVVPPGLLLKGMAALRRGGLPTDLSTLDGVRRRQVELASAVLSSLPCTYRRVWSRGEWWHVVDEDVSGAAHQALTQGTRRDFELLSVQASVESPSAIGTWRLIDPRDIRPSSPYARALGAPITINSPGASRDDRDLLAVDFPIDVVYTWVDGSDPEWRRRRHEASLAWGAEQLATANDEGRFASNDELRFSLRSLEAFAPWVNHVYLVTAGQVPAWLDPDAPGLTVIDHRQIFDDPEVLPTFNSHAIESNLHRVPGLEEHFIYANDDVFFGRPVDPEDFYVSNGAARFFPSRKPWESGDGALPVDRAAQNNSKALELVFGQVGHFKMKHTPHPQIVSTLRAIEAKFPDEVRLTAAARFRSSSDLSIPSALAHYFGLKWGRAVPSDIDYQYVDCGREDVRLQLARLISKKPVQVFCLNEVVRGRESRIIADVARRRFLESYFPLSSSFEQNGTDRTAGST